ncbi:MAG: 4-hydroxy-tetrahydrodipicolinate reductase [Clostridia bacterium]|nr:4-hydroxy-tetrahydrodipicolinate reductase [Clostridia bacterium]
MTNILLVGASGKMGRVISSMAAEDNELSIICGVDKFPKEAAYPIYPSFAEVHEKPDVIVDFSNPASLEDILSYATKNGVPAVIATTGLSDAQVDRIREVSKQIPIFFTFNMSLGVNLLCSLAKKAASVLGDRFDIEIVEKHHNQKLDAPSGTALMLADALNSVFDDKMDYEYDRHSKRAKRPKNEIGIHSVRGGTIVGEHEIIFAGHDEVLTLSHSAGSKEIFAAGALKAAKFLKDKTAGLYDMYQVVNVD